MSTTYAIDGLPAESAVGVTSILYDAGDFVLQNTDVTEGGNHVEANYIYPQSDSNYPVTCRITINRDPRANGNRGVTRTSVRIGAWQTTTIDSELRFVDPIEAVVSVNSPGRGIAAPGDALKLITGTYGLLFTLSANPGAPQTVVINKLASMIANALTDV